MSAQAVIESHTQHERQPRMIPALTVRQPWAMSFFRVPADLAKNVENRTWTTQYRGRLAIHAGTQIDPAGMQFLDLPALPSPHHKDFGVILGTVELVGCHVAGSAGCHEWGCYENPWAFHPVDGQRLTHWNVDHPREFETPIPAKGRLQLWQPSPSVAHLIETAVVL